ncbi:RadC family protein [Phosphitispora fastidiosa]|uniref:RadC family protein n=1 Tax=Phosphitispora fastidiosa TaxID=2837202 RepID=UPI001E6115FC|nr:DNA repair protein RadC [Phosphitispora fastidiosa]MBU7006321.1 DNA repair protein RadC [Phosphitispora fastidiosa]
MYRIPVYRVQLVREKSQPAESKHINSPFDAFKVLGAMLENEDRENFVVMMVDTKHKIIGINTVSVGTLNSSPVHPREVFKPAMLANAAAVILGHNHPSGEVKASPEDIEVTRRLEDAGAILGIEVLDHVIVGHGTYYSLKEAGCF